MVQIHSLQNEKAKKNFTIQLALAFVAAMVLTAMIFGLVADVFSDTISAAWTLVIIYFILVIITFLPFSRLHASNFWPYICSFLCVAGFVHALVGVVASDYILLVGCFGFGLIGLVLYDMADWSHKPGKIVYLFFQLLALVTTVAIWWGDIPTL